jgi:hypothetical protein
LAWVTGIVIFVSGDSEQGGVLGPHDGSACGETLQASLIRNSFTLQPRPSVACQASAHLTAVAFAMHQSILIIVKNEASHEGVMADSAQDKFSDSRVLDAVRQRADCYFDDRCLARRDLTGNQIILASLFPCSSPGSPSRYSRYTSSRRKMPSRTRALHGPRAPPYRSSSHIIRDSSFASLNNLNGG